MLKFRMVKLMNNKTKLIKDYPIIFLKIKIIKFIKK
jgi:hypothetical protein